MHSTSPVSTMDAPIFGGDNRQIGAQQRPENFHAALNRVYKMSQKLGIEDFKPDTDKQEQG